MPTGCFAGRDKFKRRTRERRIYSTPLKQNCLTAFIVEFECELWGHADPSHRGEHDVRPVHDSQGDEGEASEQEEERSKEGEKKRYEKKSRNGWSLVKYLKFQDNWYTRQS